MRNQYNAIDQFLLILSMSMFGIFISFYFIDTKLFPTNDGILASVITNTLPKAQIIIISHNYTERSDQICAENPSKNIGLPAQCNYPCPTVVSGTLFASWQDKISGVLRETEKELGKTECGMELNWAQGKSIILEENASMTFGFGIEGKFKDSVPKYMAETIKTDCDGLKIYKTADIFKIAADPNADQKTRDDALRQLYYIKNYGPFWMAKGKEQKTVIPDIGLCHENKLETDTKTILKIFGASDKTYKVRLAVEVFELKNFIVKLETVLRPLGRSEYLINGKQVDKIKLGAEAFDNFDYISIYGKGGESIDITPTIKDTQIGLYSWAFKIASIKEDSSQASY